MGEKKVSKAQMKATAEYEKKAYYKVLVRFPSKLENEIREAAGESVNGFIVSAVAEKIKEIKEKELNL